MPAFRVSCDCGEGFLYTDVEGYGRFRICHREGRCEEEAQHIEAGGTVFKDPFQCSRLRDVFEAPKQVTKLRVAASAPSKPEPTFVDVDRLLPSLPIPQQTRRRRAVPASGEVARSETMSHSAFEITCAACGSQSTAWTADLGSDQTVECPSCGSFCDSSAIIQDALRSAIEHTIDTRWAGAHLGIDMEDWAANTHCFVIRADDRQYRLIVGDRVRRSGDIRGAIGAIRNHADVWIRLVKDGGSVLFTVNGSRKYAFSPWPDS